MRTYVWLGENRRGLGWYLYEALESAIPVIGVAKTMFRGADKVALPLIRGKSRKPLLITAAGLETKTALQYIERASGDFRIPTLLKLADTACKEWE